jgi:2,3-bisphosphoglycerate-independent phosphoglycerate mutase
MDFDSIIKQRRLTPIVLIILDGWGLSPSWGGNAIAMNNPPNINSYWREYQHAVLRAFKPVAGSVGTIANSEIGHASIGTGRMIEPDINDINNSIKSGSFFENKALLESIENVKKMKSSLHLVGLVSDGSVHSHINHLYALLKLAKKENIKDVFIHVITDGRDTSQTSAIQFIEKLEAHIKEIGVGKIATICGRFYAMDRTNNWQQIELTYKAQAMGIGRFDNDPLKAVGNLYKSGFSDEFFPPTVICENTKPITKIRSNDSVIFFNFRADRARELTRAYVDKNIFRSIFVRKYPLLKINFTSITDYKLDLPNINIAFNSEKIESNLARIIANHNFKQLHIAESEKLAHVTYFFNGGIVDPNIGEERIIVNSPNVKSYDLVPEMSAKKITENAVKAIKSKKYDFILMNYANVDMVGHTGNILATSKAVEIVDDEVGRVVRETIKNGGLAIITADHGNAEQMLNIDYSKDPETIHSVNPVPLIMIANEFKKNLFTSAYKSNDLLLSDILSSKFSIADIAPTILEVMNIAKPTDMTGESLIGKLE